MQRDRCTTFALGDAAGLNKGHDIVVNAHTELDGDRNITSTGDGRLHDATQQSMADRQGCAATMFGHLWYRATEVHVDMVNSTLLNQPAHGFTDLFGNRAVQLDAARRLVCTELGELECLGITFEPRPSGDHLIDVQPGCCIGSGRGRGTDQTTPLFTMLTTQCPKRHVGHTGHGSQNHRWPDSQWTDPQLRKFARRRRCWGHTSRVGRRLWGKRLYRCHPTSFTDRASNHTLFLHPAVNLAPRPCCIAPIAGGPVGPETRRTMQS